MDERIPLIFSNKVSPSPWNGGSASYNYQYLTWPGYVQPNIFFYIDDDGSSYTFDYEGTSTPQGTWTTTPGTSYEVMSTVTSQNSVNIGSPNSYTAQSTGGLWVPITGAAEAVAAVVIEGNAQPPGGNAQAEATFQISIRKVGTVTPIVVSTFTLYAGIVILL